MQRNTAVKLNAVQLAALGLAGGTIVSVATYLLVRLLHSPVTGQGTEAPIQPAVSRQMSVELPHHFTEDLVIPGITETGIGIERQDDTLGRSPEGV